MTVAGPEAGSRLRRAPALAAIALTSVTLLAACGAEPSSAVGVVVRIDPATSLEVAGFTLRTGGGEMLDFVVGAVELDGGAFAASHIRAHLATSQPIAVAFRVEDGARVAYRLVDAPWFTP